MTLKILIAEDNEKIAELYAKALEERGHEVTVTYNGRDCVQKYETEIKYGNLKDQFPFDVVLIDQDMPIKDGATAVGEILDMRPAQRILFATGHEDALIKNSHKVGRAVEVLNKPFGLSTLIKNLETKTNPISRKKQHQKFRNWDKAEGLSYAGPGANAIN